MNQSVTHFIEVNLLHQHHVFVVLLLFFVVFGGGIDLDCILVSNSRKVIPTG